MVWPSSTEEGSSTERNRRVRTASQLGLAVLALSLGLASAATASTPYVEGSVRYLQEAQNPDGGFAGSPSGASDPDFSAWAALGLASAGVNPLDQARPGGTSVFAYLLAHAHELEAGNAECAPGPCTTELDRALLVVDAAGTSAGDFGGVDLQARLLERQLPDGGFAHSAGERSSVNDTEFAILALSPQPGTADVTRRAAEWLISAQGGNGAWSGEVDETAAAVEALDALHLAGAAAVAKADAVAAALRYLRVAQEAVREPGDPGGLPEIPLSEADPTGETRANVASTAWASQALWSNAMNPEGWAFDGGNPLTYMVSMQQPDGHIRYRAGEDSYPVWMTAYVLPAFNAVPLPIVNVPRNPPPAASTPASGPGAGGVSAAGSGDGVIAGGGGAGAHDFTRPRARGGGHAARHTDAAGVSIDRKHTSRESAPLPRTGGARNDGAEGVVRSRSVPGDRGRVNLVRGVLVASRRHLLGNPTGLRGAPASIRDNSDIAVALGFAAFAMAALGIALERRRPAPRISVGGVVASASTQGTPT